MFLTVFTPTYNRADRIYRAYESLRKQTFKDFEWLIIDDGSTDNTEDEVKKFIEQSPYLTVRYIKIKHGGKHFAYNKAYDEARGEFFFQLDSDDSLYDEGTLELLYHRWNSLSLKDQSRFCGIFGYYIDQNNNILGRHFDKQKEFNLDFYERIVFRQEFILNNPSMIKTAFLRKEYFPSIDDGLSFFPEWIIWLRLFVKHQALYLLIPDLIYRYYLDSGDSVSKNMMTTKVDFYQALFQLNEWFPEYYKKYPLFFEKVAKSFISESKKHYSGIVKYDLINTKKIQKFISKFDYERKRIRILGIKISWKKRK